MEHATNGFDETNPEKKWENWDFSYALYFTVSLCSSAGAFSLPSFSPVWAYGFAAVSMMIGVPLMALSVSSVVILLLQGQHFKKVKKAAWEPVQRNEMLSLKQLGLSDGDDERKYVVFFKFVVCCHFTIPFTVQHDSQSRYLKVAMSCLASFECVKTVE